MRDVTPRQVVKVLHGASVGSFILLVQAEILVALALLASKAHDPGMWEVPREVRHLAYLLP
ncbi:hypothetical protein ACFOY2_23575 [Nonomuraea purpurea]|uniref:Uncharacterized protein n=1 Tax=Nonomuraea purpurea TaxID=1849276 RepID=A0ABV8GD33_9ACTN